MSEHAFNARDQHAVYQAMAQRRDMRHFNGKPLAPEVLGRLLQAAHMAPSVGLMQPWRFIRVTDDEDKHKLHALVERERQQTAEALGERQQAFLSLKVEGILHCSELLVVALPEGREKHVFGRRTMPHMDFASACCAIQNMWLAARVEGIGMGWVSLFDPDALKTLFGMPSGSDPVAILCLGHVDAFYDEPMLITEQWASAADWQAFVYEGRWPSTINDQRSTINDIRVDDFNA